ncbi:TrbC/VirB2 family protein [Microvirga tunisiensis]|uniref:TrbC/VirB2 family protein n=1 Tax=Microvirga tunisiensis TaxID=2108360 RepID=A0A5N7MN78_9HYPH|nr:TrbC/VirB2 family protein [Microvirga tunisiensis]MPR10157.1 TrbC/VirB2 family protein [Microvirga tunisiensis]MPR28363.1 TrbC/VirB2 family protein [Microvirga tunisiensis]
MKDFFSDIDFSRLLLVASAAAFMSLIFAAPSAATVTGPNFEGVQSFLNNIVGGITGPIGVSISALAVMAVGFSFMTGRMDWTFAVSIIVGIAIVFGAATFVKGITPH